MAKEIDKIIQSKTAPKSNNVLWDDGENLKINRNGKWESAGGGAPMINITYANLVTLRDNGELIAGMQYRITDYVTTTAQKNTRSAGHKFDIIVTADSNNTLNEVARACLHEGDTYFSEAGANLAAWQIWYSLDNDTKRFAWARIPLYSPVANNKMIIINDGGETYIYVRDSSFDSARKCAWLCAGDGDNKSFIEYIKLDDESLDADDIIYTDSEELEIGAGLDMGGIPVLLVDVSWIEGTGVIYRMIDEWNNDIPYDFKNIQFKRNLIFENGYAEYSEDGNKTWVYTFAGQSYHINNDKWSNMLDGSLESPHGHMSDEQTSTFSGNIIKPYIMIYSKNEVYTECGIRYLNDNVFLGYWEKIGSANDEDMPYYYAYCCCFNTFGNNCYSNSLENGCSFNTFGNDCCFNNLDYKCKNNSFVGRCYHIKLSEFRSDKIISINSSGEAKVFNLADLADLLN